MDDENLFDVGIASDEDIEGDGKDECSEDEGEGSNGDEVVGEVSFKQPPHSDYDNSSNAPSAANSDEEDEFYAK